ncbi:MAG: hypothetical protein O3A96_15575 [Proteobacteria bacterium]|nr:hypothetical protein [Pseudomonadota bacterium]
MSDNEKRAPVGRRDLLKLGAVGLAASGLAAAGLGGGASVAHAAAARPGTPDEALAALKEGNAR